VGEIRQNLVKTLKNKKTTTIIVLKIIVLDVCGIKLLSSISKLI